MMRHRLFFAGAIALAATSTPGAAQNVTRLPPNEWVLLHRESNAGGKEFAKAIYAQNTGQLFLWGTGGNKPARNVYERYELEVFGPDEPALEEILGW